MKYIQNAARTFRAMRMRYLPLVVLASLLGSAPAANAATRLIVQVQGGLTAIQLLCRLVGCTVQYGLGDPQAQTFLVTSPLSLPVNLMVSLPGVLDVEIDQVGRAMDTVSQGSVPAALYDSTPVTYYGTAVREGYVTQPAAQIVRLAAAQSTFRVGGAGAVAVIDTGVDPTHPVLQTVLLPGYDFTRNRSGANETLDLSQSISGQTQQSTSAVVDQSTSAVVDQYAGAYLDQPQYQDFGHGTMVAGVIHLVAPRALILPLKAFRADGTGYLSDVIRAIYYAEGHGARVLNMSFSFASSSLQLNAALTYANLKGVISVAAAGNSAQQTPVYPAAYKTLVMGVVSTSNSDTLSTFSNYGPQVVWVGAPGEGIVTLYPFGTYAAAWGTSFSAPFVSGTAALLLDTNAWCSEAQAAQSIAHAKYVNTAVGNGRLDVFQAIAAWQLGQ